MQPFSPENESSVRALGRGLEALKLFSAERAEWTQSQLAEQLDLSLPTVHRLVSTLVAHGFLIPGSSRRGYRVGPAVVALAASSVSGIRASETVRSHLEALTAETGETTNLATLVGREVIYLDSVRGKRLLSAQTPLGLRVPAHTTALGLVLLARLDPDLARDQLGPEPYTAFTPRTRTAWESIEADLTTARRRGTVVSDGEFEEGSGSIAAALAVHAGQPDALAINVSFASGRSNSQARKLLEKQVLASALNIDRELAALTGARTGAGTSRR
jgi:DNA-binding IclR family transcriptional regulator